MNGKAEKSEYTVDKNGKKIEIEKPQVNMNGKAEKP